LSFLSGLLAVALHTLVLYLFLIFTLTFIGRRQISELSIIELVIVMSLGSSVETAMVAGNTSLPAGLVSATTLLLCNKGLAILLARSGRLRKFVIGRPIILVYKGRLLEAHMRAAGLTSDDVLEGIRERGYERLDQIRLAVFELNGTISVVPNQ
jgi:uncharacterized membrane protein YcaP (DUF421 family)